MAEPQKTQLPTSSFVRGAARVLRGGPSRKEKREAERAELRALSAELSKHAGDAGKPREIDLNAMMDTTIELRKLASRLDLATHFDSVAEKLGEAGRVEDRAAALTKDVGKQHQTIQALLDLGAFKRRGEGTKTVLNIARHQHRQLERVHNGLEEYREHLNEGKRDQREGVMAYARKVIGRLANLVMPGPAPEPADAATADAADAPAADAAPAAKPTRRKRMRLG